MNGWMMKSRTVARGFTIVELLIVIVIIGILAAIAYVGYGAVQNSAHDTAVKSDLQKIDDEFKLFALDNGGQFPDTLAELSTLDIKLTSKSYNTSNFSNVYLCMNPADTEYAVISMSRSGKRFVVKSETGVKEYAGTVLWSPTQDNRNTTCASIDSTYTEVPGGLTGFRSGIWASWTGVKMEIITNLAANPSFEVDTAGWTVSTGVMARSSTWATSGTSSVRFTKSGTGDAGDIRLAGGSLTSFAGLFQAGKTYTVSADLNIPVNLTGNYERAPRIMTFSSISGAWVENFGPKAPITAGIYKVSHTFTIPSNANGFILALGGATSTASQIIYYDSIMITEGSQPRGYADGTYTTNNWSWNGAAHSSSSTGPSL